MKIIMNIVVFLVILGYIVLPAAAEICHYKSEDPKRLQSISCEHGCCGDLDLQKCCNDINWWMIFAFILVGLFIIFVVTVSIFLIVKQKNKKKEQVGTRQSNGGLDDQPNMVDLSIFRTENSRRSIDHPPAYTFDDPPADAWGTNGHVDYPEHFTPDRYPPNQNPWRSRDGYTVPEEYREHASHAGHEPSWRDTDLSYFDNYLERTRNPNTQIPVALPALGRSHGYLEDHIPPKDGAVYEELRISTQPELTAEVTYRGQTDHHSTEHPILERTDSSTFHFMTRNNS